VLVFIHSYLGIGGSDECTDTALYFSSFPSMMSSTSEARRRETLDANTCWLKPMALGNEINVIILSKFVKYDVIQTGDVVSIVKTN